MTWRKHSAQAASLQHRLLPTDGYQWQGMAEQHRQGPMHSCSPPPSGMSYLTQTKRHAHGGKKMKTNRWFPVKNQRKTQITRRLFLFDNSSIFLDTNSFRYFWMPKLKRAVGWGTGPEVEGAGTQTASVNACWIFMNRLEERWQVRADCLWRRDITPTGNRKRWVWSPTERKGMARGRDREEEKTKREMKRLRVGKQLCSNTRSTHLGSLC